MKTDTKKLTQKQAQSKIDALLKGIDNSAAQVERHQGLIKQSVQTVKQLLPGLGNQSDGKASVTNKTAAAKPVAKAVVAKPAAKAVVAKPAAKPAKAAKAAKAAAKPAAKPAKAEKTAAKPKAAAAAAAKPKAAVDGRPALKVVLTALIDKAGGKPVPAATLYHEAVEEHGYWSRQSLYNALKDSNSFSKQGDGFVNVKSSSKVSDTEAESFVDKAGSQPDVSSVA